MNNRSSIKEFSTHIGPLHFVGIGGIGMSGIAEVLHTLGFQVQGSDIKQSDTVDRLTDMGINVTIGHDTDNLKTPDGDFVAVVVVSSAIPSDNPEIETARERMIPVVRRAEMLAELMRLKISVAVGGTHGKTTTTSMIAAIVDQAGLDPTVINGGIINAYGATSRLGQGDWLIAEADESDGSFTKLPATMTVITNIEAEHMDHYGDPQRLNDAFITFAENIPFYGVCALCVDDPGVHKILPSLNDRRIVTYGLSQRADIRGSGVAATRDGMRFDVIIHDRLSEEIIEIADLHLPMHGAHNVLNALGAMAVTHDIGIPPADMRQALNNFGGVQRRFTTTGKVDGITIIDDYGHHPTEISAVLRAGSEKLDAQNDMVGQQSKIIAVFQPHRYSRVADLFDDFCRCFNDADAVIVSNVYAAGEDPIDGFDQAHLMDGMRAHGMHDVYGLDDPDNLPEMINDLADPGDLVICLGAGDITKWAHRLPGALRKLLHGENNWGKTS